MPKKLPIISTLIGVSISTLGATVPTFANTEATYTATDVAAAYTRFTTEVKAACGEYSNTSSYSACRNDIASSYKNNNPGEYAAIYSFNRTLKNATVSAYNPYAGTMRFYINNDHMFASEPIIMQDLMIFWADSSYAYSSQLANYPSQNIYAWRIADAIISGEAPQGVHIMYNSSRNKDDWFISGVEHRVVLDDEANFLTDSVPKLFFILGHDTNGVQYVQTSGYGGACSNLGSSSECQLQFYYTEGNTYTPIGFASGQATAEDLALIERKEIIKEARASIREAEEKAAEALAAAAAAEERAAAAEAEAAAARAEADIAKTNAANAEASAREAEVIAREAEAMAREAENIARAAEATASEAAANAREAEAVASEAAANAREAEAAAREAENSARAAEERANELATSAKEAELAARAAEAVAREAEAAAREAENVAREAAMIASEASKNSEIYAKAHQELTDKISTLSSDFSARLNELNEKIMAINGRIADSSSNVKVIEKVIQTPTIIKKTEVKESPIVATAETGPASDQSTMAIENVSPSNDEFVEVPIAGKEAEFPWWIIVFVFSGIALTLWWFVPARKKY